MRPGVVLCYVYVLSTALIHCSFAQPNIVLVFADDFGFDIGAYGAPTVLTPNMDRMCTEGMKFTQWYSGENICSPSRAALLTGRYALRSGVYGNLSAADTPPRSGDHRVFHPDYPGRLADDEILLPSLLKQAGYATGAIGKWHLGFAYGNTSNLPVGRGFDQWMGTPATHCESGGPYPPEQLFKNTNRVGWLNVDVDVDYLTENYTTFAVDFMNASVAAGKPFFLYAAFDNTHSQVYYSPRFAGASRRGPFGDATMELDWAVGQIMDSVEALGVRNNTVVVFTSDNGAWSVLTPQQGALPSNFIGQWASNPNFASDNGNATYIDTGKGSTWEGGHRVPAMAWGAPHLVATTTTEAVTSTLDLLPTFCDLAGVPLPTDRTYDGASFKQLLSTGVPQSPPHRDTFFYYGTHYSGALSRVFAMRYQQYKAHWYTKSGFGSDAIVAHDPPIAFDVEVDPQERYPITLPAATAATMAKLRAQHEASMDAFPPQLDVATFKCMDCAGLPPSLSACCTSPTGVCGGSRSHEEEVSVI